MIGISLSDLHLGFRRGTAVKGGRYVTEMDVEVALDHAVDRIVAEQPAVVLFGGDQFDNARPSQHALNAFLKAILRIVRETKAFIFIVSGNHCGTRTLEALSPNTLATRVEMEGRVFLAEQDYRREEIEVDGEPVVVDLFPYGVLGQAEQVKPTRVPGAVHIAVIHAAVRSSASPDALPYFYGGDGSLDIAPFGAIYDVISCGDYHSFTRLHPTKLMFYSGSLAATSSDVWKDAGVAKGVVRFDTDTNELELLEIPTRPVRDFDLEEVLGDPPRHVDAITVNEALRTLLGNAAGRDAIVRLTVDSFPREEREMIDQRLVRELRDACTQFTLDIRYRETALREVQAQRASLSGNLDDEATQFLSDDSPEVRDLVMQFLTHAGV